MKFSSEGSAGKHRVRARRLALTPIGGLALLLTGAPLFAPKAGECHVKQDCLAVDVGQCLEVSPGNRFMTGTQSTSCEIYAWGVRIPVSGKTANFLDRIGMIRFWYY